MFRLSLTPKKCSTIYLDFETEEEFYDALYTLEKTFSGKADFILYYNDSVYLTGCIGLTPCNVFNPLDRHWYSFEHFIKHPFDFPLTTRLLYRKYLCMDKMRLYGLY